MSDFHREILDMFLESQYWLAGRMLEFQHSQLSQLLLHAKANVPFYKTRLDPVLKSDGTIDWKRWNEIPITKRSNLANEKSSMLAVALPPGHGPTKEVYSSGSSGKPISITQSHLAMWVSEMALHRSQYWHRMDWSQNFLSLQIGNSEKTQWPDGWNKGPWGPAWVEHAGEGTKFVLDRSTHEEKVIEFILRKKIRYLASRPLVLHALALSTERLKLELQLDAVISFGGEVSETAREDLQRIFGTRIIALYSSEEGCKIAVSCETGTHYHANSELNFIEILDDSGNPCPIGEPGRVIITTLFNTAQPLIRYEQGDIAVRGPVCSCGKTLPVLQKISGRINDMFEFPGGRKIAPSLPDKEFTFGFGAKIWQLVQVAPLIVELRYVQRESGAAVDKKLAREIIHKRLHSRLQIRFVKLEEIPLTTAGKFIQYKSELRSKN
jgi:phenylacetate-CoA ligase